MLGSNHVGLERRAHQLRFETKVRSLRHLCRTEITLRCLKFLLDLLHVAQQCFVFTLYFNFAISFMKSIMAFDLDALLLLSGKRTIVEATTAILGIYAFKGGTTVRIGEERFRRLLEFACLEVFESTFLSPRPGLRRTVMIFSEHGSFLTFDNLLNDVMGVVSTTYTRRGLNISEHA